MATSKIVNNTFLSPEVDIGGAYVSGQGALGRYTDIGSLSSLGIPDGYMPINWIWTGNDFTAGLTFCVSPNNHVWLLAPTTHTVASGRKVKFICAKI